MTEVTLKLQTTPEQASQLLEESSSTQLFIKRGILRGELGHPIKCPDQSKEDFVRRLATVDEKNVSHTVKSLEMNEDGTMTGVCQPLKTPSGELARQILESGNTLQLGMRAFVAPDKSLSIISVDLVSPSE